MGGFHGGHDSGGGGGFHGGSSSSGGSSYSGGGGSSYSGGGYSGGHGGSYVHPHDGCRYNLDGERLNGGYSGGGSYKKGGGAYDEKKHFEHTVRNGHHYYNGVRYYGGYYGLSSYDKPVSFKGTVVFGLILSIIGLFVFLFMFTVRRTATITSVTPMHDRTGEYVAYEYEYTFNGYSYLGEGDDDDDTFAVGQTYSIYIHVVNPEHYEYKSHNVACFLVSGVFLLFGLVIVGRAIFGRISYRRLLNAVGDANGDGLVDEKDIEYHEKMLEAQSDAAGKDAKKTGYGEVKKDLKCPYCDSLIEINDKFCKKCGGALGR